MAGAPARVPTDGKHTEGPEAVPSVVARGTGDKDGPEKMVRAVGEGIEGWRLGEGVSGTMLI